MNHDGINGVGTGGGDGSGAGEPTKEQDHEVVGDGRAGCDEDEEEKEKETEERQLDGMSATRNDNTQASGNGDDEEEKGEKGGTTNAGGKAKWGGQRGNGKAKGEDNGDEEEETDIDYRLRVYGTSDPSRKGGRASFAISEPSSSSPARQRPSSSTHTRAPRQRVRRFSRRLTRELSRRGSSFVAENLPDTPKGWAILVTTAASAFLQYELRLQRSLTAPPYVFCQRNRQNDRIRSLLSSSSSSSGRGVGGGGREGGIFTRPIKPSLLVGTRGVVASAAAYALPHRDDHQDGGNGRLLRLRETLRMGSDGAEIAIDWEVPPEVDATAKADGCGSSSTAESPSSFLDDRDRRKHAILHGPIDRPVVLVLHGINNDASFGYVRSLMKACTDRGWIAVGFNFRGCGRNVSLKTPRGYNGAYTGDLRSTIQIVTSRMSNDSIPLFLVGNSLGANLVTKYLGEEGRGDTLPPNVAGGISLGNPLHIHSGHMSFPWAQLLGLGVRKMLLVHRKALGQMTKSDGHFRSAYRKALLSNTIGDVDNSLAPFMIRNEPDPPYNVRIGYRDGEEYWNDASSYRYVQHVSVPLLKVTAQDDFLVYGSSLRKVSHCLENPNVVVVKTRCGGHLGWRESPPDTGSLLGFGTSWADLAAVEFIDAVIRLREEEQEEGGQRRSSSNAVEGALIPPKEDAVARAKMEAAEIQSRL